MNQKVLQIGMHTDAAAGGADRYACELSAALSVDGWTVSATGFTLEGSPDDTQIESLGNAGDPLRKRLRAIRERVANTPHDHLITAHFALYALPLVQMRRRFLMHFHGPWAAEAAQGGAAMWVVWMKRRMERWVYQRATHVITLSEAFRSVLIKDYGVLPERISVIPGGVDFPRFASGIARASARRELGWPEEGPLILSVRRLTRRMGLEQALSAFGSLVREGLPGTLVLGGTGELGARLKLMRDQKGLQNRVLLPGFISEDDLPRAFRAADFSLMPSQALEGFGLTVLESLASGTPVLVTPVGGMPEVIRPFAPEWVLEGPATAALEKGMRAAMTRTLPIPDEAACRAYAARFSWDRIARQVGAVYRTMESKE